MCLVSITSVRGTRFTKEATFSFKGLIPCAEIKWLKYLGYLLLMKAHFIASISVPPL